jgi:hypothetical protein
MGKEYYNCAKNIIEKGLNKKPPKNECMLPKCS